MTAPTDAQWLAMSKLVQTFFQRQDAEPFREPVDWKALGLYDYPQIIKKPMDLGTIKKKITDRKYKTIHQAAEDVRLVWSNCMTYNQDGSDFYLLAKSLNKKWEDKFEKFVKDQQLDNNGAAPPPSGTTTAAASSGGGETTTTKVSLDDKRNFARSLYKISKEDLGKLIVEIDTKCPAALTKNAGEDECEFNVDKLPPALFHELKQFVATCNKSQPPPKKKKK